MVQRAIKVFVFLLLSPFWWPVAKAMWLELKHALLEEGGLFGRKPTEQEVEQMRGELGEFGHPLISEPWARRGERQSDQGGPAPGQARGSAGASAVGVRGRARGGAQRAGARGSGGGRGPARGSGRGTGRGSARSRR